MLLLLAVATAPILAAGVSPTVNTNVPPAAASSKDTLQRGIVATNQIAHSVTSTLHIISDLVPDLNTSTGYYMTMAKTMAAALDDLHAGRVVNATDKLNDALGVPSDCDIVLSGVGVIGKVDPDAIRKENDENERLVHLAINISTHGEVFLTQCRRKRSYIRAYTNLYERTHAQPTSTSTFERLNRHIILRFTKSP
uniref:Pectinesterase inhibitor domain-containing protein n=1 Tax=Aegilops tauschii TaxID=37682 RepID=M8BTA8_AEGTA